jgi:hypothetical protein
MIHNKKVCLGKIREIGYDEIITQLEKEDLVFHKREKISPRENFYEKITVFLKKDGDYFYAIKNNKIIVKTIIKEVFEKFLKINGALNIYKVVSIKE